jgi:hypothetical protein
MAGGAAVAKKEKGKVQKNAGGGDKGGKETKTAKDWPSFIEVYICSVLIVTG